MVELLAVILVISILVGLVTTAASSAMKQAKIARARSEIATLGIALRQYYNDYSQWPTNNINAPLTDSQLQSVYLILSGSNFNNGNPRQIAYLHVPASSYQGISSVLGSSGAYPAGGSSIAWVDPWMNAYMLAFDSLGNGQVTVLNPPVTTNISGFAIWSAGPDMSVLNTKSVLTSW